MSLSKSASEVERLHVVVGALDPAFSSILTFRLVMSDRHLSLKQASHGANVQEDLERLSRSKPTYPTCGDFADSTGALSTAAALTSSPNKPTSSLILVVVAVKIASPPPAFSIRPPSDATAASAAEDVEALNQVREVDLQRDVRRRRRR